MQKSLEIFLRWVHYPEIQYVHSIDFTFLLNVDWAETSAIHLSDYPVLIWLALLLTFTHHAIAQIKLLYIIADSERGF